MSIDAISKPIYYNLLDYSKKQRDLDYLIDKTNRHFCEIKNLMYLIQMVSSIENISLSEVSDIV